MPATTCNRSYKPRRFDLGYVALAALKQLRERQVFFICRWQPRFEAFTLTGQSLDLRAYLAQCDQEQEDLHLAVGAKARMPLRLIAVHLPPAVCEQRRRRANQTEQKRGFTYTTAYKTLLDWNLYLTNTASEQLTGEQVRRVSRLRWQVELLFKLWKSAAELDRIAGKQAGRVLCELYAKLIGLAGFGYLSAAVRLGQQELSPFKAWQVLQRQIPQVAEALRGREPLEKVLAQLYGRWQRFGMKERVPKRPTTFHQLQQEIVQKVT